jgi:solute:Na+ symporter, SSS family
MLSTPDIAIIGVYLAGTVAAGILAKGRQANTGGYFLAGGAMRGFFQNVLVGLSLAATMFSGISMLAFPSVVYSEGIGMLLAVLVLPGLYFIVRYWFLPRYMPEGLTHPYEIIERNLGSGMRTAAAGMFILLRVGWMAALIYAPTVAIMACTALPESWFWPIILIVGLSSTL